MYVSEYGNHRVSVFDTEGNFLRISPLCCGRKGSGKVEFNYPYGLTTDKNGNLYVCDSDNNRVVIYWW